MVNLNKTDRKECASSRGVFFNTGKGFHLQILDVKHPDYVAVVDPDTAFWALIEKKNIAENIDENSQLLKKYREKSEKFSSEMEDLRFNLALSAVYFNPTERCNLNCNYCYIPESFRKNGRDMSKTEIFNALDILKNHFNKTLPKGRLPQIVFHGSEPMLNRESIFEAMDKFKNDFAFGIQTNGTLLDDESIKFLSSKNISIGLSLDGHISKIADMTRKNWAQKGVSEKVVEVIKKLKGYHN